MNLPSKNIRRLAECLEEINRLNRMILIFPRGDFSIARKISRVGAVRQHICGGVVVAMKKAGKK